MPDTTFARYFSLSDEADLRQLLIELIDEGGWTQKEIASAIEAPQSTLSEVLNEVRRSRGMTFRIGMALVRLHRANLGRTMKPKVRYRRATAA
jgi:predicted XRE-type DNA-binding protein